MMQRALALLSLVELVTAATVLAALYCRAVPVGHRPLLWRRIRAQLHARRAARALRRADVVQVWRVAG